MNYVDKNYWDIKERTKFLLINITYSFIFYIICIFGLIKSINYLKIDYVILIIGLCVYFTALLGWTGGSRYNLPIVCLCSIFFSIGLKSIINSFNSKNEIF